MNLFFIICEYEYRHTEVDYFVLTEWEKELEESYWEVSFESYRVNQRYSLENLVNYYIELCSKNQERFPFFFNSLKEAKEVVDIIKAHDDPEEKKEMDLKFYRYHIIKSEIKCFPAKFLESFEA